MTLSKVLVDHHDFGLVVGISMTHWLIGISIHQISGSRVAAFRVGPLYLHIMFSCASQ